MQWGQGLQLIEDFDAANSGGHLLRVVFVTVFEISDLPFGFQTSECRIHRIIGFFHDLLIINVYRFYRP